MAEKKKAYDGTRVVEHVVQPGQTYSRLAAIYGLPRWQAIQIYNTQVRPILASAKPEHLPAGREILIPRSPKGYERWLKSLAVAKAQLQGFEIAELASLEAIQHEANAGYVVLDFAGDVLTMFGSLAAKGRDAYKAATQAYDADIIDAPLANALQFTWAQVDDLAHHADDIFERLGAGMTAASGSVRKGAAEKLFDSVMKLSFETVTAKNIVLLRKLFKAGWPGAGAVMQRKSPEMTAAVMTRTLAAGAADGARAVLEYLDYLKPSTWNKIMLVALYGESVEGSVQQQSGRVQAMVARQIALIDEKEKAVKAERKLLFGV